MIVLKLRTFWWKKGNNSNMGNSDLLQNCRVGRSRHGAHFCNLNLTSISYSFWNITRKVLKFKKKKWSKGRTAGHIFGREPSNDYFIKILFLLSKWFQTRRFLWEFPRGSYVKLSSAVVAILVGVLNANLIKGGMKFKKSLLLWNYWANLNQTLLNWFLGDPLPKLCPAFQNTDQDGHHSRT
jgi:hypothetical protein